MNHARLGRGGERRLPDHGEERLAVRKLKAKDGLGVRCKQRGLGHRQVP